MAAKKNPLLSGTIITSAGTLASRVLGLVRDMVTAALFGLAAGGVLDALVIAFRIPNLFRALFGEGALTASYLPVFSQAREQNPADAWRLYAATMRRLAVVLIAITAVGEIWAGLAIWLCRDDPQGRLLAGLAAVLLPYLILVCLAAITSATLQAVGRFGWPALAPAVLNLFWIAGAAFVAPRVSPDAAIQVYVLAGCILVGGLAQWAVQWPALWRAGYRGEQNLQAAGDSQTNRDRLKRIYRALLPTTIALTVTQLNTLSDSLVAWLLAAPAAGSQTISWLGGVAYPMQQGAVAAIYFGERLYQFPLGLIGIATATVVFPLLSSHAARGDLAAVSGDLSRGLRLVLMAAVPSAVGLVILAEPISRLMFEHGQFTANDAARTARMVAIYGSAVWAYCALPVLVRGFYALEDQQTPLRLALVAVALNFALDLTLIWPLAEAGLAAATAISAILQAIALAILFSRKHVRLDWQSLAVAVARTVAASAIMALVGVAVLHAFPSRPGIVNSLVRVATPIACCVTTYWGIIAVWSRVAPQMAEDRPVE